MKLRILIAGLLIGVAAFAAEAGGDLFQKATTLVRAGNLEEAIKLYQRVATEFASDRPLAAKALMAEAKCYETLGQDKADKATKLYEQVAKDFSDQTDSAKAASARLVVIRQAKQTVPATTMTQRKIALRDPTGVTSNYTDGQCLVFKDSATGALMISDIAGNGKRAIFTPKDAVIDNFNISRDCSLVLTRVTKSDKSSATGVVRTDGKGYREIAGNSGASGRPCGGDISWDDRSVLFCQRQPDGPPRLVWVSLADGKIHKVLDNESVVSVRFSPDGRFISYLDVKEGASVVSSQGGEPHKLTDAHFIPEDWTRDGQYLICVEFGGTAALYLIPMKDGQQAVDRIFVRDGDFSHGGQSTVRGAYVYPTTSQIGAYTPWLGSLDPANDSIGWKKLNLASTSKGSGGSYNMDSRLHSPTWSPDGTQIAYLANGGAASQMAGSSALRLYDIASGKDRELKRDVLSCWWSSQPANILCTQRGGEKGEIDVLSVSTETGHAEPLGTAPEALNNAQPAFPSRDGKAIYIYSSKLGLVRWGIGSPTWTTVHDDASYGVWLSPDERWIARTKNTKSFKVEIRPLSGGDWVPLAPANEIMTAGFTSDGNWFVYHGRDASGKDGLFRVPTSGGAPERLGDFPNTGRPEYGDIWIGPDGKTVFADTGNSNELWMLENFEPKQQAAK